MHYRTEDVPLTDWWGNPISSSDDLEKVSIGANTDDLMGLGGGWSEANSVGGGWSEATSVGADDAFDELQGILGAIEGGADEDEIGRRANKAARKLNVSPNRIFSMVKSMLARRGGGGGGQMLPADLPGLNKNIVESSIAPGTPARGQRVSWLAFPKGKFTASSTSTTFELKTTALRPLKTVRVAGDFTKKGAADILLTIGDVKIGKESQPVGDGEVPFRVFDPLANGIPVSFDPIDVNVPVSVFVICSSLPAGTDEINFSVSFHGYTVK